VMNTVAQMSEVQGLEVLGILSKPFSEQDVRGQLDRWRHARRADVKVQRVECTADEIEAALGTDRIEVHYQPKARLSDGEVVGVEALVRLRDPYLGSLLPVSFLGVAERSGLMPAITQRVLQHSLRQASQWDRDGLSLDLSVNLAPSILQRLEWPDTIAQLAARYRYPVERLTLEVTEQHVDANPEMLHNAARFRIKGFQLSVDDFGTGDSGISRLRSLPFTELKVDRSFTVEAAHREDLRTMLQTSIELAHRLHMDVVAEGVETWEQWAMLKQFGCDSAQGNLASPALPAELLPDAMAQWRVRVRGRAPVAAHAGAHG
jgi:EAL domain-containing protein (putative c-di-GMP-specific phosphodiesterase class I)